MTGDDGMVSSSMAIINLLMIKCDLTKYIVLVSMFSMLAGCSGISVSQDYEQGYDFAALKTFAWKPNDDKEYGVKDNELVDKRIRKAIVDQLSKKSYVFVESATPDFFISYDLTIKQKITSSGVSGGVSLGRSSHGGFGGIGISSGSQVRAYDQGTLLIDIIEPLDDKLIWRGVSTQTVYGHSSPDESKENINETVEKMLEQFPPK